MPAATRWARADRLAPPPCHEVAETRGLTRVRGRRTPAADAAQRVVDLYLRARFGHQPLGDAELREMSAALGAARMGLGAQA